MLSVSPSLRWVILGVGTHHPDPGPHIHPEFSPCGIGTFVCPANASSSQLARTSSFALNASSSWAAGSIRTWEAALSLYGETLLPDSDRWGPTQVSQSHQPWKHLIGHQNAMSRMNKMGPLCLERKNSFPPG